jgi:hypothetical protein
MQFAGNEYLLEGDWGIITLTAAGLEVDMTGPVD